MIDAVRDMTDEIVGVLVSTQAGGSPNEIRNCQDSVNGLNGTPRQRHAHQSKSQHPHEFLHRQTTPLP